MKKFTFLLSLLLAFVGVTASAQNWKISDAPNGEEWAANTQWYLIRVAAVDSWHPNAGYLSTEEAYIHESNLRTDVKNIPSTDKGLWCIVGNETDGYKFYNKGEGTSKVLGFSRWAKMYDKDASEATVSFDLAQSSFCGLASCVKLHGKANNPWWNNANNGSVCSLGTWDGDGSTVATAGNAFLFIPVNGVEGASDVVTAFLKNVELQNTLDRYLFIPGVATNCAEEKAAWEANMNESTYSAYLNSAKKYLNKTYYRITNCKDGNKVLAADETQAACVDNAQKMSNASTLWKFIPLENNRGVKLYNANVEAYLGDLSDTDTKLTPMKADEAQGSLYNVSVNSSRSVQGFVLRDGNNGRMNMENGGEIDKWEGVSGHYDQVTWTIDVATELEVALNAVNGKSYATTYLPVGVSAVKDAKAYVAAAPANNETVMTETASFGAKTGVLLVSETAAGKAVLTIGEATSGVTSALSGTLLAKDITNSQTNYLVFGKNKDNATEVGFFEPSTSVTSIPANRAFFEGAAGAIALNFGGNVTAIDQVVNNANVNAPIFDLAGRRVVKAAKGGVYIQNGKKFIVK